MTHALSLPRRVQRPEYEGGWRAEKRKILMARALRHAGASRRANHGVFGIGPCFRPVRRACECADRSVSQLLAGTPSGPGGSSNAARVPSCEKARRRRTPSRLTTPHETPLNWTRWVHHKRGSGGGDYAGIDRRNLVIPAKAGIQGRYARSERLWIPAFAGMTEFGFSPEHRRLLHTSPSRGGMDCCSQASRATLDTSFRRYDGPASSDTPISARARGVFGLNRQMSSMMQRQHSGLRALHT